MLLPCRPQFVIARFMRATQFSILFDGGSMRIERRYFVYIMVSKPRGTLYVGVTGDLQSPVYLRLFENVRHQDARLLRGACLGHLSREAAEEMAARMENQSIRTDNPDWKDLAANWDLPGLTPAFVENWVARIAQESATGR